MVSSTLRSVDAWPNSSLIDGNVTDQLTALKRQDGNTIGVHGSITLVNSLLSAGLLDELRLTVFPALAGRGRRLFEDGEPVQQLTGAVVTDHRERSAISGLRTPELISVGSSSTPHAPRDDGDDEDRDHPDDDLCAAHVQPRSRRQDPCTRVTSARCMGS